MSKKCLKCGFENEDSDSFCQHCYESLEKKPEAINPTLNIGDATAIMGGVNINQSKNIPINIQCFLKIATF